MSSLVMRSESMRIDENLEHRKGIFFKNYFPILPPKSSSENKSADDGIREREDKFTLESEQLSQWNSSDQHGVSATEILFHTVYEVDETLDKTVDEEYTKNVINRTHRIILELLQTEEKYIASLKKGIKDYIVPFDTFPLPKTLFGQRLNIFSNIEVIQEIHEKKFYPKLVECGYDPAEIADVFINFIQANNFDNYISYVVSRKTSSILCEENKYFFMQLEEDHNGLGVESFLLQPVQRLPKYRLMLDQLVKELANDLQNNKNAIAKCCVAEKNIQRLLNTVNEHCE